MRLAMTEAYLPATPEQLSRLFTAVPSDATLESAEYDPIDRTLSLVWAHESFPIVPRGAVPERIFP